MTEDEVIRSSQYLADTGFWHSDLGHGARAWLDNFDAPDRPTALELLRSFIWIPQSFTDGMVSAAFNGLAAVVCAGLNYTDAAVRWKEFRSEVIVTFPTGEIPSPTDSGYSFQRMARQLLELHESQIVEPERALQIVRSRGHGTVVFLDDFVGSGDQFIKTWRREYRIGPDLLTFERLPPDVAIYYVPLIATEYGAGRIESVATGAQIQAVHRLEANYSAKNHDSRIWINTDPAKAADFVERYTVRAGYDVSEAWGYHDLGLTLAFEHSTPDATLPILYSEEAAWRPLVRRR